MEDAYSVEFTPPVKKGQKLELIKSDTELLGYYRVKYIEPLPKKVHDFGAIDAEATSGDVEVTDLYMSDGELACYQMIPLDDVEITISQPKAKKRYATKSYVHTISPIVNQVSPLHTRIFVWEDEKIFFNVKNPTRYNRPMHRVMFYGWRLILEKTTPEPPYTTIEIEGA
jgi:hypothetical protein